LTLFYNPSPNPNTKSNSKSNPNPGSHRFVWRDRAFTLKMFHSPFAPARVTLPCMSKVILTSKSNWKVRDTDMSLI